MNQTRFGGVFLPNSDDRARLTPVKQGRVGQPDTKEGSQEPTPAEGRASMTWGLHLKWVFGIDIETCPACDGPVRISA
ncbi:hypothetical protein CCR91_03920 [Thiorhodovibrio winogradskyi]|nr:hypothetical protein [Thiorhodovibrio winogradskyi]